MPQFNGQSFSAICSLRPRPLIMTGVLRDILMRHFSSADNVEEPDLRERIWQPGQETDILIESYTRWVPEISGLRPAIVVKRNAFANTQRGVGDRRHGADEQGNEHFATLWTGSHTLFCIDNTGAAVELLAAEIQNELTQFAPALISCLKLLRFRVTQVGAIDKLEEAQETWVVPVTVGYQFEQVWTLREEAPRLHRISLSILNEI